MPTATAAQSQAPPAGRISLDHIAHFVPEQEAARHALVTLGFAPTPFSVQYHRSHGSAELVPVGTGNYCVMLREGYIEFLVPLTDTPVASQLRMAIGRYVGAHSIVFGSANAESDFARLRDEGFAPLAPIALQRSIDTPQGEAVVRFSVVRVPPGTMDEGRIQYCQHHSAELVWQQRWLDHPNGALRLRGVSVCVADLPAAVRRYERFTGLSAVAVANGVWRIETQRGWIEVCERAVLEDRLQAVAPALPWIAGCTLACRDVAATRRYLEDNGMKVRTKGHDEIIVAGGAAIGGIFGFVSR